MPVFTRSLSGARPREVVECITQQDTAFYDTAANLNAESQWRQTHALDGNERAAGVVFIVMGKFCGTVMLRAKRGMMWNCSVSEFCHVSR